MHGFFFVGLLTPWRAAPPRRVLRFSGVLIALPNNSRHSTHSPHERAGRSDGVAAYSSWCARNSDRFGGSATRRLDALSYTGARVARLFIDSLSLARH